MPISLFDSTYKFGYLGSGYTLFYNWFKQCIIVLFILSALYACPALYSNMTTNYCDDPKKTELCRNDTYISKMSYPNKFDNESAKSV